MPAGLKQSSSVVSIGFSVSETAPNTFTQGQVDLNLSPLDREVMVVLAVNLDSGAPDAIAGVNTAIRSALTTTSQTAIPTLQDANCLSRLSQNIQAAEFCRWRRWFLKSSFRYTTSNLLEYIGIIATNDFFVQVQGTGNLAPKGVSGKLYGYRAVASADIYAALVQSEVLSA